MKFFLNFFILSYFCHQDRNVHYKGTLDALKTVIREDGVQRLYKGLSPAILRQVNSSVF